MKLLFSLLTAAFVLAGCGSPAFLPGSTGIPSDANGFGGLPDDQAAHASVELASPNAFALTPAGRVFLSTLSRVVVPMRQRLASRLQADAVVTRGLAGWDGINATQQLQILTRVAQIEGDVMGFQVPPISQAASDPNAPGVMAYFESDGSDAVGQVVLYPDEIAQGGKYLAVATLVHEMRHAAQYQLASSGPGLLATASADQQTLITAYSASWQVDEEALAYGDYAHLNVEYDAFQTGNEVATMLSNGQYDATGIGFVDTHYGPGGTPGLNLLNLSATLSGPALIATVNRAEYQAETNHAGQNTHHRHNMPAGFKGAWRARAALRTP